MVTSDAALSAGASSGSVALSDALLVKVPPRVGATVTVTLVSAPGASGPSAQVTFPTANAQPVVAETNANDGGSVSVATTFVAVWVACWLRAVRV